MKLLISAAVLAAFFGLVHGEGCDDLSTQRRKSICGIYGDPGAGGIAYEKFKKVDSTYWVTTKKYPNKMISPHQLADACVDEFGPDALPLELKPKDNGGIDASAIDPEEAVVLTYFWGMDGFTATGTADQVVLMNYHGSALTKGGTLSVLVHRAADPNNAEKCHTMGSVTCKSGLVFEGADQAEFSVIPYLRVGCVLKAPPANAEQKENVALGNTPVETVDKIPVAPAPAPALTNTPTGPPRAAPVPATPGGPGSGPGSALTPQAAPGPIPAAAPGASPAGSASISGDPHLKLLNGKKLDFMGGCDLVLLSCPSFASNLGMRIHVRTKIKTWWSFVEAAVLQIGEQTIELQGGPDGGHYWINGKIGAATTNEGFDLNLAGFKGRMKRVGPKKNRFRLDFGNGNALSMETFKSFVSVNWRFEGLEWKGAIGLLGSFDDNGAMMSRNRSTIIENPIEFGKHWQVSVEEPMLFHSVDGAVQAPEECVMPDLTLSESRNLRRRLGASLISQNAAEMACAHVFNKDNFDACVFDVLATNDREMTGAY